jgi:hypothetical protein
LRRYAVSGTTSITDVNIPAFITSAGKSITRCGCLEDAAQKVTDLMYTEFKDSVVLARLFATVPFGKLPTSNKEFIRKLAEAKGVTPLINEQSPILSLLGTSGEEDAWNDRRKSRGHIGVPLVSEDFIDQIPMMSRLLKSLGLSLDWLSGNGTGITQSTMGKMAGIFYVADARTAVDEKGRKIIAAQDFVAKHNVRTVFGVGGGYVQEATFIVLIVFAREQIDEERARCFLPLATMIKAGTTGLLLRGRIFKAATK